MPNNLLDLMGYVQHQGELGTQTRKRNALAQLTGAYAAGSDPDYAGIAENGGNPLAFRDDARQQEDQLRTSLGRDAALLLAAPPAARSALYRQNLPKYRHFFQAAPEDYSPELEPVLQQLARQSGDTGGRVQSSYIDDRGHRMAIMRDGTVLDLGGAAPNNQILDTGDGYVGVDKRSLKAAPVVMGTTGPAPAPPVGSGNDAVYAATAEFMVANGVPPEKVEAWLAQQPGMVPAVDGEPDPIPTPGGGGQLRKAPAAMTPYQEASLDIRRQSAASAQSARQDAAIARQAATDLKAQAAKQREAEASQQATQLVNAIDRLTGSPGFADLGTVKGDASVHVPLLRTDAKDSNAQLRNIAGQVALTTMAKLKTLSAAGATGFGALTAPELKLLENSIAALQAADISHGELAANLKIIRTSMQKIAVWKSPTPTPASPAATNSGKYALGQIIEHGGKRYRVTGLSDPNDPDVEEVR